MVREEHSDSSLNSYLSSTHSSSTKRASISSQSSDPSRLRRSTLMFQRTTASFLNRLTQSTSNSIISQRHIEATRPSASIHSTDTANFSASGAPSSLSSSMIRTPTSASEESIRSLHSLSSHDIVTGLLRASHAESKGATADLLLILGRTGKGREFEFGDVEQEVIILYGTKDDRISLGRLQAVQKEMRDCQLQVINGGDHNLMTSELSRLLQFHDY